MAYESGKIYYIVPYINENVKIANLALNLEGSTYIKNNRNVNLYIWDYSFDQKWIVKVFDGYAYILCAQNIKYGLDYYYGKNNKHNCDIYKINGNEEDCKINFRTIDSNKNIYYIQSYRYDKDNDLYLTASSFNKNSDVRWENFNKNKLQKWHLIETKVEPGAQKFILINETVNQYYQYYNDTVRNLGCALCSALTASIYYGYSKYNTVDYLYKYHWSDEYGFDWITPKAKFSNSLRFSLDKIKNEIDNDRPVAIHANVIKTNGDYSEHWILAFGYINDAKNNQDIYVIDPFNPDKYSKYGRKMTLTKAMSRFKAYNFDRIRISKIK